jgi:hypothetical protein
MRDRDKHDAAIGLQYRRFDRVLPNRQLFTRFLEKTQRVERRGTAKSFEVVSKSL